MRSQYIGLVQRSNRLYEVREGTGTDLHHLEQLRGRIHLLDNTSRFGGNPIEVTQYQGQFIFGLKPESTDFDEAARLAGTKIIEDRLKQKPRLTVLKPLNLIQEVAA